MAGFFRLKSAQVCGRCSVWNREWLQDWCVWGETFLRSAVIAERLYKI